MVTEIKDSHGIVIGYADGSGYAVYRAPLRVEFNGKPLVLPDDSPADEAGKRNARHAETLSDIKSRNIARPILDSIVEEGQRAQRDNAAGDAIARRKLSR